MNAEETPLAWIPNATPGEPAAFGAACGPYAFEIRTTPNRGFELRMWLIRSGDSPILLWENDGYTLKQAQARAVQLAAERVPAIEQPA